MKPLFVNKVLYKNPVTNSYITTNEAGLTFPVYAKVPVFVSKGNSLMLSAYTKEGSVVKGNEITLLVSTNDSEPSQASFINVGKNTYIPTERLKQDYSGVPTEEKSVEKATVKTEENKLSIFDELQKKYDELKVNKELRDKTLIGAGIGLGAGLIFSTIFPCCKIIATVIGGLAGAYLSNRYYKQKFVNVNVTDTLSTLPDSDEIIKRAESVIQKRGKPVNQETLTNIKTLYTELSDIEKKAFVSMMDVIEQSVEKPEGERKSYMLNGFAELSKKDGTDIYEKLNKKMKEKQIKFN